MTDSKRLFKVCPRSRDVSLPQREVTSIVLYMCDAVQIAGPFGAREGFGEQLFAAGWIDHLAAEEIHPQAVGQQDLVAEQPGARDSLFPEWKPSLRVAAEVTLSPDPPKDIGRIARVAPNQLGWTGSAGKGADGAFPNTPGTRGTKARRGSSSAGVGRRWRDAVIAQGSGAQAAVRLANGSQLGEDRVEGFLPRPGPG